MTVSAVSAVQFGIGPLTNKEEFWDQVMQHMKQAIDDGSRLVVFPEYVTGTLLALESVMNHAEACDYMASFTDEYMTTFSTISKQTGITILGGTHITKENDAFLNAAYLFMPNGDVIRQTKVHSTPEERNRWNLTPGDRFTVQDTEIGRVAILTCYDIEFPEAARIVAGMGADIILCPSYTDGAEGYYRVRYCAQARAIENQVFVVLSGLVGYLPHVPQIDAGYSQAGIFSPCDHPFPANGVLALGETNNVMTVSARLDSTALEANRAHGQVAPFNDRRLELYNQYNMTVKRV